MKGYKDNEILRIKSKYNYDCRRVVLLRHSCSSYEKFYKVIQGLHHLEGVPFVMQYISASDCSLLIINNDSNLLYALETAESLLRMVIQRKGESFGERFGYGPVVAPSTPFLLNHSKNPQNARRVLDVLEGRRMPIKSIAEPSIQLQDDFHHISSIIDVDSVPGNLRRVRLRTCDEKPLGFYIRDGISVVMTHNGIEKVPGIFISRLVPGGLADSTGLLAVNDEVVEVNSIEVKGKPLDQVTDMMLANVANLTVTVKPANQSTCLSLAKTGISNPAFSSSSSFTVSRHLKMDHTSSLSSSGRVSVQSRTNKNGLCRDDCDGNSDVLRTFEIDEEAEEAAGVISV